MGADLVIAFFGIKIALDPDDEETLEACGAETDPRCVAATAAGLQVYTGRMTDGEDYFLYIGHRLGQIGLEGEAYTRVFEAELLEIAASVRQRLVAAGFRDQPALHLQLEAQY